MTRSTISLFQSLRKEWITLVVLAGCYIAYAVLTLAAGSLGAPVSIVLLSVVLTLHSSLQHEVIHGHPFAKPSWNTVLVLPPIGLFVPYHRFRDTHLAHHQDSNLTDPYDDPESAYMDLLELGKLPRLFQHLLRINNTLFGRMVIGPALSLTQFYIADIKLIAQGDRIIARAYLIHVLGLMAVVAWLHYFANIHFWIYILSAYGAMSILKIRTFVEHQAHESVPGRTAVVDDRGPLAWLFLFNNFHSVHHRFPRMPWHRLPAAFDENRDDLLARNKHYYYTSYIDVFKRYLWIAKDGVAHPLWSITNRTTPPNTTKCRIKNSN